MREERTWVSFGWAIKRLLRDKANYAILEGFLTTLLGKEIKVKKFTKSESDKYPKAFRVAKFQRMESKMRIVFFLFMLACVQMAFAAAQTVAVLPSEGVLNDDELEYLTDKAQEIAVRVLPKSSFEVFPQEVVIKRLGGADSYVKECKESSCIVDLGKKAMVDYVAQCRFGKLGSDLRVTFELYKVSTSGLIDKFSESAKNIDGLLAIMQEKIPDGFKKIPGASSRGKAVLPPVAGGIRDLERAVDYELGYGKYYIANIATEPQGAVLSFDGEPNEKCPRTPCKVELAEGRIRILASLEQYERADTTVSITRNEQDVVIKLKPNFGVLEIKPVYSGGIGRDRQWNLLVNDKYYSLGEIRLSPGSYDIKLNHECYENIGFKVGINKGSREVFDMDKYIVLKKGGLVLSAEKDGEPVSEPVFVNGIRVGETPFSGSVPLCSEIEIGSGKEKVDVELKYKGEVKHKHIMRTTPEYESQPYTSYNFPQVRNRTPPPYGSQPYTSSTEDHNYEEIVSSITKNDNDIKDKDDDKAWKYSVSLGLGVPMIMNSINTLNKSIGFLLFIDLGLFRADIDFIRIGTSFDLGFVGVEESKFRKMYPQLKDVESPNVYCLLNVFAKWYPVNVWYLSGGMGYGLYPGYTARDSGGNGTTTEEITAPVFSIGTGLVFFPSYDRNPFLEVQYNMLQGRTARYLSIKLGLNGSWRIDGYR